MTAIYSHFYWGRIDEPLATLARATTYHHTIVTAPDGTWVADGLQRESKTAQQAIHELLLASLDDLAIPYLLLAGEQGTRMQHVHQYLQRPPA